MYFKQVIYLFFMNKEIMIVPGYNLVSSMNMTPIDRLYCMYIKRIVHILRGRNIDIFVLGENSTDCIVIRSGRYFGYFAQIKRVFYKYRNTPLEDFSI